MRFILEVEDSKEGQALMKFLRQLSFVRIGEAHRGRRHKKKAKIDESFGIWRGREVTKEILREKAWRI